MAKRDKSREVVEEFVKLFNKIKVEYQAEFTLKPVQRSPKEERLYWQNLDPDKKLSAFNDMGKEAWDALMEKLYAA